MALRIHLSWGPPLTVLAYGALAAGAAWLHAVDYDGHLYAQLLLHAVGGLLLGGLAWAFSERVAYAANLNTKPVLRLAVAGVLASYAGAWVASPYTEFTAGARTTLAPLVSVGLYVAAGVLPLVAALALLSFLETLFAAVVADVPDLHLSRSMLFALSVTFCTMIAPTDRARPTRMNVNTIVVVEISPRSRSLSIDRRQRAR